jgi:translocation and assembly module TamB
MSKPTPAPDNQDASAAPVRQRRPLLRRFCLTLAGLLLALLTTTALLAAAGMSDSGTRQVWRLAVWAMQGQLSGQYLGGNLAQGVRLRDLHYHDAKATLQIDIDRIDSSWQLAPLQRKFSVAYLRIGQLSIRQAPTPSSPTLLPDSLRLPLALELREIALHSLRLQQGSSLIALGAIRLHGSSDGVQHTLALDQLDTGFGNASALLHLDGRRPFATSGGIELDGLYRQAASQEKFHLAAQLSGSLQALGIELKASGDKLNGSADVIATPFATVPLKQARIQLQHVNPRLFNPAAPQADLQVQADLRPSSASTPEQLRVSGPVSLVNLLPGSIDRQRLPLNAIHADLDLGIDSQQVSALRIDLLKRASLTGSGQFRPAEQRGAFDFQIEGLDLHALHQQLKPTQLRGPLHIKLQPDDLNLLLQLQDKLYGIDLDASLAGGNISVRQARLSAAKARLELSGTLATDAAMAYAVKGRLSNFDPSQWLHQGAVAARINMNFDASGSLSPQAQAKLNFNIHDSTYNQLPMSGSGSLQLAGTHLLPSRAEVLVAGNRIRLQGSFGNPGDRLAILLDAPQLARLGYGLGGQLKLDGQLSGALQRPSLRASYSGTQLSFGAHHLGRLSGQADLQTDLNAAFASPGNKLMLSVDGQDYRGPDAVLRQLKLELSGTYGAHVLKLQADGKLHQQTLALQFAAHGKLTQTQGAYGWSGEIDQLANQGLPRIELEAPLHLELGADTLLAGTTRLQVDRMNIDLHSLRYQQGRLQSQGSAKAIDVSRLLALAQQLGAPSLPLSTDLVLDADWNFTLADSASGFLQIARKSGDFNLNSSAGTNAQVALGLSALQLRVDLAGQQAHLDGRLAAARIGTLQASGNLGLLLQDGNLTLGADSPLALETQLQIPNVKSMAALLGPQYSFDGKLALQLKAAGTLAKPRLSGQLDGDKLAVTLFDQGIQLKDGIVHIAMDDNLIDLRQIEFHGGEGTLRATGKVQLGENDPDLKATIVADRLQLFASPDRQLMLSGQARLANLNEQLRIDGKFTVDKALFDLPKTSAPKLGDDVVIVRRGKSARAGTASAQDKLAAATEKPAGRLAPVINVQVNLGNDFRFNGSGADLHLRGDMTVRSEPLQALYATGTIQVADGTYEAFGTKLNIERGIINFQGQISNPNLNILAMRRNQDVAAGVEVTGPASAPRVKLVSEPTVSDDDKLSWLMFGHASDSSGLGQRSASSQALAFVGNYSGKKIAKDIGLDQFSIGASESGLTDTQVVNLGKAISDKLSLGYEQSLSGAASVAKLTWQLSQRWSAVARAGTINGINFVYSLRFD